MEVRVVGNGFDLGEALRKHVEENIIYNVDKYFHNAVKARVSVSKEGRFFHVDVIVNEGVMHGPIIKATAKDHDPYSACDNAIAKIGTKLRKYKHRLKDHKSASKFNFKSYLHEYDDAEAVKPVVVEEETMQIRHLSIEDAAMYLDLMSAPAVIFINLETSKLNIMYKKGNGHLVLVDTNQHLNGN